MNNSNPFQITTPEDLTASEMVQLFVDVFNDFQKVIDPGHVFLTGPRGVGKSMMFRYLQPDCQCLKNNCGIEKLPFISIYIPLKNTNFSMTELKRLEDRHASDILNEHILVTFFTIKIFESMTKEECKISELNIEKVKKLYRYFSEMLSIEEARIKDCNTVKEIFEDMAMIMQKRYKSVMDYTKKLAFTKELFAFQDELFDYLDFLLPLLEMLSETISGNTIYLLIDDAQMLSEIQTRILNSWVSTRTSRKVSLKISTQYNYKTFYTSQGSTIDSPHDFSLIDMATIYTGTSKSKYRERIEEIVNKRLNAFGINSTAQEFFKADYEQEEQIELIADQYRKKFDQGEGRGHNRSDDAIRYSRPDFIKSLSGSKKSSSTYSYSGFEQLVHLSSGIVRYFLEPAHLMYAKENSNKVSNIEYISSSIQNEIIRDEANRFLFSELDRIKKGGHEEAIPSSDIEQLTNLIEGLGGLFRIILLSDRSERRIFSVAISDKMSARVEKIFDLGVQMGYFHQSTIGRKEPTIGGRTKLFVMNRRLAPIWTLDPNGFAGYLFVKNEILEGTLDNPIAMLRRIGKESETNNEYIQLSFFADESKLDIEEADYE